MPEIAFLFLVFITIGSSFSLFGPKMTPNDKGLPLMGEEELMSQKGHGTSKSPVMKDLRWQCDWDKADQIVNFNRHWAEHAGYWEKTSFLKDHTGNDSEITFYDSVTGKPLFVWKSEVRSWKSFVEESKKHGWPSFRDEEVVWENVRCLKDGETVSIDGSHLGHNLPDGKGNRYCINLVSVCGTPK